MTRPLSGRRIGLLERPHPPGYQGALVDALLPLLRERGALVDLVHAERGFHRLDRRPPWDLVVLKSGSAAARHVAAAAEAWGIPAVNGSDATRLAQDKLASVAILRRAGLPIAPSWLAWLGPGVAAMTPFDRLADLDARPVVVKAARGSQGRGLWMAGTGKLSALAPTLPDGPYLIMAWIEHGGDDLKVYAAGPWLAALARPFPATTLEAKRGRPMPVPADVAVTVREVGRLLGLTCYGCDFVQGDDGWTLVDVNAFPGYKGAEGAAVAIAAEIERAVAEPLPR